MDIPLIPSIRSIRLPFPQLTARPFDWIGGPGHESRVHCDPTRTLPASRSQDPSHAQSRPTVSDQILDRLADWGVTRLYGYPGDGINGVMGALNRSNNGRSTSCRSRMKSSLGLMATAHAKFTGDVGVCIRPSGPGAIHMLNGLYDAKLDHQPVVAIVGQQAFAGVGGSSQQETNLRALLQDVASSYLEVVSKPEQLAHVVDRAFRAALGNRTVAAIILPHDVQLEARS